MHCAYDPFHHCGVRIAILPSIDMSRISESETKTVAEALKEACTAGAQKPLRYFPADFIGETSGAYAIPFPEDVKWKTLAFYADLFCVTHGAMLVAPLYWQTEPIFWDAMHALNIPMSVMHGGNIPLAREIIKQARFEMAIVDADLADAVCDDLSQHGALEQLKILITFAPLTHLRHNAHKERGVLVLREFHLIPGYPLLYQRPGEAGTNRFRVHDNFLIETTPEGTYLTARTAALPLTRARLPMMLAPVPHTALVTIV